MQNKNSRFRGLGFALLFWAFSFGLLAFPVATCAAARTSEIAAKAESVPAQVVAETTAQI
jgi:hypothetical protein